MTDDGTWSSLITPGYCFYNNAEVDSVKKKWGALYNWYTVQSGKLAPSGWHIPTDSEWTVLESYLIANGYSWDGTTTGNKIAKAMAAKSDWINYTEAGTIGCDLDKNNASIFSAVPGGCRSNEGNFHDQSFSGLWWSATENSAIGGAFGCRLSCSSAHLNRYSSYDKSFGFSVRLVGD